MSKPAWVKEEERQCLAALKAIPEHIFERMNVSVSDGAKNYTVLSVYLSKGKLCIDIEES